MCMYNMYMLYRMHVLTSMPLTADSRSVSSFGGGATPPGSPPSAVDGAASRARATMSRLQGFKASRLQGFKTSRLQGFKGEGDHVKASRLLGFKGRLKVQAGGVLTVG